MESIIEENDFLIIRDYIKRNSGISLNYEKEYLVRQKLNIFLHEKGFASFKEFAQALEQHENNRPWREDIISLITTNETFFFRDQHPFENLSKFILPEILSHHSNIRAWSAGCSTGQEAYSLAMLFAEYKEASQQSNISIEITATDIDKNALDYAVKGVYNEMEIKRGLKEYYLEKYFKQKSKTEWEVLDDIKKKVSFSQQSLHENRQGSAFLKKGFQIILARNVLIYFSESIRKEVLSLFNKSLSSRGILILGSSESLYGLSDHFTTESFGKTIVYRKH